MPKITVNAKTTFNPISDSAEIKALYTGLAVVAQTNRGGQIAADESPSYNCAYFTPADNLTYNGVRFSVGQNFLCKKVVGKEAYHCLFIGHQLGEGSFAKVYSVDTVVEVTPTSYLPYGGYAQPKVIKEQGHCACTNPSMTCGDFHNPMDTLKEEYKVSAKIDYLGVETPQVVRKGTKISYTVMNELSGTELFKILSDDDNKTNILTIDERMELTLELYKALQQVSDLGIVHRDLKPENIMVDRTNSIKVKILDYGLAKNIPEGKKTLRVFEAAGTPAYVAPETFRVPIIISSAMDLYSLTRILLILWGGVDESFAGLWEHEHSMREKNKVKNLFRLLPKEQLAELSRLGVAEAIKALLAQGLMTDPDKRGTVEEAITKFEEIYSNYAHQGQSTRTDLPQESQVAAADGGVYSGAAKACAVLGGPKSAKVESKLPQPGDHYGPIFAAAAPAAAMAQPAFSKPQGAYQFASI